MTGEGNAESAEARADLILGDEVSAKAYASHFEAQLRVGKIRRLLWAGYEHLARGGAALAGFDPPGIW